MTKKKERKKKQMNPWVLQILELSDRDFKVTIINMVRKRQAKQIKGQGISTKQYKLYKTIKWTSRTDKHNI